MFMQMLDEESHCVKIKAIRYIKKKNADSIAFVPGTGFFARWYGEGQYETLTGVVKRIEIGLRNGDVLTLDYGSDAELRDRQYDALAFEVGQGAER